MQKACLFFFFLSFLYIFKGKILEIRVEELLYSPDGDRISCFIHVYILIFIFICIVLNPPVQWNALFSFLAVISASAGATGVKFSIQQLERVRKERDRRWKWRKIPFPFYLHNVMSILQHVLTYFTVWLHLHHGCSLIGCSGRALPLSGWHWGGWERRQGADRVWLAWLWKEEI